jgi:signal transduction histidine kinase
VAVRSGAAPPADGLPRWAGRLLLAVLIAFGAVGVVIAHDRSVALLVVGGLLVVAGGGLTASPGRVPALLAAAIPAAGFVLICSGHAGNIGWFGISVLAGWCALVGGRRDGLGFAAAAAVVFTVEWVFIEHDPGWAAWIAGTIFPTLAALLVRHEVNLVAQLREAQAGLTQRAQVEERNRIAHELHDVIAHSLIVSLLHVTSARLAVEHDPADAARALAEAERLGRETLAEVRRTVGLLRADGDGAGSAAPLPGAGDVTTLVERFRSAGADIELVVDGETGDLPATSGLAVYRILQEALTNAAKHAPGSSIAVRLTVDPDALRLAVHSAGRPGNGTGLGLVSMRERAESVGGSCAAGPADDGWTVRADLPLDATVRRGAVT